MAHREGGHAVSFPRFNPNAREGNSALAALAGLAVEDPHIRKSENGTNLSFPRYLSALELRDREAANAKAAKADSSASLPTAALIAPSRWFERKRCSSSTLRSVM